jgi:hypothetical protein
MPLARQEAVCYIQILVQSWIRLLIQRIIESDQGHGFSDGVSPRGRCL